MANPREIPNQEPKQKKKIKVLLELFDADGTASTLCRPIRDSIEAKNPISTWNAPADKLTPIPDQKGNPGNNQHLIDYSNQRAVEADNKKQQDETLIRVHASFSNRQSADLDQTNAHKNGTQSSFIELPGLSAAIARANQSDIFFFQGLLTDLNFDGHNNDKQFNFGEAWEFALDCIRKGVLNNIQDPLATCLLDYSKIVLTYFLIHAVTKLFTDRFPPDEYDLSFEVLAYDDSPSVSSADNKTIFDDLFAVFNDDPSASCLSNNCSCYPNPCHSKTNFLPENVTLDLIKCKKIGEIKEQVFFQPSKPYVDKFIRGTGKLDHDYRNTLKKLIEKSLPLSDGNYRTFKTIESGTGFPQCRETHQAVSAAATSPEEAHVAPVAAGAASSREVEVAAATNTSEEAHLNLIETKAVPAPQESLVDITNRQLQINFNHWLYRRSNKNQENFTEKMLNTPGIKLICKSGSEITLKPEGQLQLVSLNQKNDKDLSARRHKARWQLWHQYTFEGLRLNIDNGNYRNFCLDLKTIIVSTAWEVDRGGRWISGIQQGKNYGGYVPENVFQIHELIETALSEDSQEWEKIYNQIHTLAGRAAKNKPNCFTRFFGGERDPVTQSFYDLLATLPPPPQPAPRAAVAAPVPRNGYQPLAG